MFLVIMQFERNVMLEFNNIPEPKDSFGKNDYNSVDEAKRRRRRADWVSSQSATYSHDSRAIASYLQRHIPSIKEWNWK